MSTARMCTHFPFVLMCVFGVLNSLHRIKGEHMGHLFRLFQSIYSSGRHGRNLSAQKDPERAVNNARPTNVPWGGKIVLSFLSFHVMMLWDNCWTQPFALIISRLNLSHSRSHCVKLWICAPNWTERLILKYQAEKRYIFSCYKCF